MFFSTLAFFLQSGMIFPQIFPRLVSNHHLGFRSNATSPDRPFFTTHCKYHENSNTSSEAAADTELLINAHSIVVCTC